MTTNKQHPVPTFPPNLRSEFESLCALIPEYELNSIRNILVQLLARLEARVITDSMESQNRDTMIHLVRSAIHFIAIYPQQDDRKKKMIVGALRYFSREFDSIPDVIPLVGYDDDVAIMNHVAEELGELGLVHLDN